MVNIPPFLTTRFVTRKRISSVKTGLVANMTVSVMSATPYPALFPCIISFLNILESYRVL